MTPSPSSRRRPSARPIDLLRAGGASIAAAIETLALLGIAGVAFLIALSAARHAGALAFRLRATPARLGLHPATRPAAALDPLAT